MKSKKKAEKNFYFEVNMIKNIVAALFTIIMLFSFSACDKETKLKDGYYTAQIDGYEIGQGWQEYVTICISNGKIITVEYNAASPTGFVKSWDMAYMRAMNKKQGTYPNNYTRRYAAQLLETQSIADVDTVSGATNSGENFKRLVEAAIEKAKAGDCSVALVSY